MDGFVLEKAVVKVTFPDDNRLGKYSGENVVCEFDCWTSKMTLDGEPITGYPKKWVIESGILDPGY